MGLTGAGKSTFVSTATGDPSVVVDAGISGVTQDVQEFVLYHQGVEVHLIDTPGFNDSNLSDHEVLDKISTWINTVYSQGWNIGGILYLYDVTRKRLEAGGQQNIRVLEEMTGKDRWQHITLVTTQWNCSHSPENERRCEYELENHSSAWKPLREGPRPARMARFHNTRQSAFNIIEWHLKKSFKPAISVQMADPDGPRNTLGETDAGQVILNSYMPGILQQGNKPAIQGLDRILGHRFDDQMTRIAMRGILTALAKAKRDRRLKKLGRWAVRLSMVGGIIAVSLVSEDPIVFTASVGAAGKVEKIFQDQRKMEKAQIAQMEDAVAELCRGTS